MRTFKDANRARTALKMTLSQYGWYNGCSVSYVDGEYTIVVSVSYLNNSVRKVLPSVYQNIPIKPEVYIRS